MPERPDVTVYVEALRRVLAAGELHGIQIASPSLLRTFDPPALVNNTRFLVLP